ncbi:MAG: glycosyltransferase family 39 protein [Nanoarchaeota archaeon]|nr:glycosyltransferase family 39 protein [Nanoarchaeota archaeon]
MSLIKKFNKLEGYTRYSFLVILAFSIIVLSLTSIHRISGDACWQLSVGRYVGSNFKVPLFEQLGRDEPFWAPPLFHFIVGMVFSFFNIFSYSLANTAIKFISPISGILTLVFSYLTIKKLSNPRIAFYSVLFLAFLPLLMDYSTFGYIESSVTFFVVLSVYFLVNGRVFLSSVAAGLGILTKYNGIFIMPVLLYYIYKTRKNNIKLLWRNLLIAAFVPALIAMPWLIRNWIVLGNPVWPFVNFIFKGLETASYNYFKDFGDILTTKLMTFAYLGFFGVPEGNPAKLLFFDIPYLRLLLAAWFIGTLIFTLPLITGFFVKKPNVKHMLYAWIGSFLILFVIYVGNVNFSVSRIVMPAVPALAVIWAFGFSRILEMARFRKFVIIAFILIASGFVLSEFVKISLASSRWAFYEKDFEWANTNTEKSAIIMAGGQCLSYKFDRQTLTPKTEKIKKADYIWINQNFRLDPKAVAEESVLLKIKENNYKKVYENIQTGTIIYKVK